MKKRGKGMASMYFGMGNTGKPNPSSAFVEVHEDGTATVLCGAADLGQGSNTTLSQIVAEELGIPLTQVKIMSADTAVTPEAGITSASRQTYVSGNAVKLAAKDAKETILREAAEMLEIREEDLEIRHGSIFPKEAPSRSLKVTEVVKRCRAKGQLILGKGYFNPQTVPLDDETGQGVPYGTYAFGTQVAEVEVDTETGEVRVLRIRAAHDVGKAINPQSVEGQIEGAVAMGIGYTLMEELVTRNGEILNPDFQDYLIPTALDVPEVEPIIVEDPEPTGPFGAKGTGEPATIPVAAAILNAIYNATGVRIKHLPATPERVFDQLRQLKR